MTIQLFDKKSNPITERLTEINDSRLICHCDFIGLLPLGAIIDSANYDIGWESIGTDSFLVNKHDLKNISYSDNYIGCCGPSGDRLDIFDLDNNPIGFEFGDCYMCHFVKIPKSNVIVKMEQADTTYILFAFTEYKNVQKIVDRALGLEYNLVRQRLVEKANERLNWEISDPFLINELNGKMKYLELQDVAHVLDTFANIDDFWLFTKFEQK